MGWLFSEQSRASLIQELTQGWENEYQKTVCLAKKCSGNDLWCVFERTAKLAPTDKERYIILFKMQRSNHRGVVMWGYKDMDESMGPYTYSCPLSFLDMVPEPPRPEGYHDWRAKVREYHAKRGQKLAVGQTIKLTNGEEYRVLSLKPLRAVHQSTGITYRIPRRMLMLPTAQEVTA